MPLFSNSIPPPVFDSDESDAGSQQSNDSSSYLSSQFHQHTRLSFSPKLTFNTTSQVLPALTSRFDDSSNQDDFLHSDLSRTSSEISWQSSTSFAVQYSNHKRKRTDPVRTPNQSPYTRRRNLHYVQENTFQSPKSQRRSRYHDDAITLPSAILSNLVNINPFSPKSILPTHRYHTRLVAKRGSSISPALRQLIIPRFDQEFRHESFLGHGQIADVALCTNRLDGLNYAIKSSKQPLLGTHHEQIAWREICAYAVLICHEHLVRYYSAWIEPDGRFLVQLEYCDGGSLAELVQQNRQQQRYIHEQELKTILHQISDVLTFMHGQDLAHLDIKPDNILLCHDSTNEIIYKLTDLSHVNLISSCSMNEDGDKRYLPLEAMQKFNSQRLNLEKWDIFALGLTLYVCATNIHLPTQDHEWQELRSNIAQYLPVISHCTQQFNELLLDRMCHIDPNQRPSGRELLLDPIVHPSIPTSRDYLQHTLKEEREKNHRLNKKLLDQYLLTNSFDLQTLPISIHDSIQQTLISPTSSIIVPQRSVGNENEPMLSVQTSTNLNALFQLPSQCGSFVMKQQTKLTGSNMFRYYSSIT